MTSDCYNTQFDHNMAQVPLSLQAVGRKHRSAKIERSAESSRNKGFSGTG
jgi:hypothetical protein